MDIDLKKEPENLYEALKDALFLHITAPTKEPVSYTHLTLPTNREV